MSIVDNASDSIAGDVEANSRSGRPPVALAPQHDDGRFAVHLTCCHSPQRFGALVVAEVRRVDQIAVEPIRYEETRVGTDELSKPVPVALVESLHIQMEEMTRVRRGIPRRWNRPDRRPLPANSRRHP